MCQVIEDFKMSLVEDCKSPKTVESMLERYKSIHRISRR